MADLQPKVPTIFKKCSSEVKICCILIKHLETEVLQTKFLEVVQTAEAGKEVDN